MGRNSRPKNCRDVPWHVRNRPSLRNGVQYGCYRGRHMWRPYMGRNSRPKTVGTCRGTSETARRCEMACNEGVIADMPHVVVFLAEERYRWLLRSPPFVRLSQERLASWRGFHHGYRLRRLGAKSMAMRALSRTCYGMSLHGAEFKTENCRDVPWHVRHRSSLRNGGQ